MRSQAATGGMKQTISPSVVKAIERTVIGVPALPKRKYPHSIWSSGTARRVYGITEAVIRYVGKNPATVKLVNAFHAVVEPMVIRARRKLTVADAKMAYNGKDLRESIYMRGIRHFNLRLHNYAEFIPWRYILILAYHSLERRPKVFATRRHVPQFLHRHRGQGQLLPILGVNT